MKYRISSLLVCLLLAMQVGAQEIAMRDSADYHQRLQWFSKAKLGIFIHWGIYAVKGVSESWSFYNERLTYD